MERTTELFLDRAYKEFADSRKVKSARITRRKINPRKFIEAVSDGATLGEAAKIAGSTAKTSTALNTAGSKFIARRPEYREAIADVIEEKQHDILHSMTKDKMERASLPGQATAFGILTDKRELLSGRPTQRVESDVNLESLEKQQLMGYILGRLSKGEENKLKRG